MQSRLCLSHKSPQSAAQTRIFVCFYQFAGFGRVLENMGSDQWLPPKSLRYRQSSSKGCNALLLPGSLGAFLEQLSVSIWKLKPSLSSQSTISSDQTYLVSRPGTGVNHGAPGPFYPNWWSMWRIWWTALLVEVSTKLRIASLHAAWLRITPIQLEITLFAP